MPLSLTSRASGLLLHITSLPSPYGIGDMGPAAVAWIDRLAEACQSWWQSLPLGPTGYGNSPYQPLSSFAGNCLLISPDWLIEDGLLPASDGQPPSFPRDAIDYNAVISFKHRLLETAWANFKASKHPDLRTAYEHFQTDHAHWLEDYALFRALKGKFGETYYLDWPTDLVQRKAAAIGQARRELEDEIGQVCFAQFLLFRQGQRLKAYAHRRGVRLIGDLPFFVSPDPTRATCGPTRSYFSLTSSAGRASSPVCLPTISARRANFGAILCTIGTPFASPAIVGTSPACARCLPMWT